MKRTHIVGYLIACLLVVTVDSYTCMLKKRRDHSSGQLKWSIPTWKRCKCHAVKLTNVVSTDLCPKMAEDDMWFADDPKPLLQRDNWSPEILDVLLDRKIFCDKKKPTIQNMPSDITQNTPTGEAFAIVTWTEPTSSDNSGSHTLTSSHNSGDSFPIGVFNVSYTSIDPSGNIRLKTFIVTIIDVEKPVIIDIPANVSYQTAIGEATVTVTWTEPTASDNSGSQILTPSYNSGDSFPIGVTIVTYTSIDPSGNTDIQVFTVTIVDTENPVISSMPANITNIIDNIDIDAPSEVALSWTEPTAADNSVLQTLISNHNPGSLFSTGITEVTYTSTDPSGNTDTQTFFLTVEYKYIFTGWPVRDRNGPDGPNWTMVSPDKPITCDGIIAQWRYQAKASHPFQAIIWRPVQGSSTQYTVVGINDIPAGGVDQQVQFLIPEVDRITAQAGDVIGWSYADGFLAVNNGGSDMIRWIDVYLHDTLEDNVMVDFSVYTPGNREYSIKATVLCT